MKFKPLGGRALVRIVEREDVQFVKLNVDDNPQTAMSYSISSIPTIARFEGGEVKEQAVGALPKPQLSARLGL